MKCTQQKPQGTKTYILLHGAWHASWCWKYITPILIEHGHIVIAPDLPGHGNDKAPFSTITLKTYVDRVTDIITTVAGSVTLVGHSMAGVVISQIAENIPDKIDQLVYVAAFIPGNNESLSQVARRAENTGISTEMIVDKTNNKIDLKKSPRLKELFYTTCSEEIANQSLSQLQIEPYRPFVEPITISKERFGKVSKLYIECLKDVMLRPDDQKRMSMQAGCEIKTLENADHSPFFSTPAELAAAILAPGRPSEP